MPLYEHSFFLGNWGLSHEAILINNRHLLEEVLTYRDYQRASKMLEVLKDLAKNLVVLLDGILSYSKIYFIL